MFEFHLSRCQWGVCSAANYIIIRRVTMKSKLRFYFFMCNLCFKDQHGFDKLCCLNPMTSMGSSELKFQFCTEPSYTINALSIRSVNVLFLGRLSPLLHHENTPIYNVDPLKPHFYIEKLGFTGVYIIFLTSAQKHRLWYSLEPPWRGGSNEYPQSMF